jgi:hypothetical protein
MPTNVLDRIGALRNCAKALKCKTKGLCLLSAILKVLSLYPTQENPGVFPIDRRHQFPQDVMEGFASAYYLALGRRPRVPTVNDV